MATFSGTGGKVSVGGTSIDVTKWSITKKGGVANVTDSASTTWEDFIASGFTSWTFTFEGFLKSGVAKPAFHSSAALIFTVNTGVTASGNGIITDEGTTTEINGTNAVTVSYSGQGTGAITEVNP